MDSKTNAKRFFVTLDGIRGMAALLVAMRHTAPFFGPERFQESYLAVDIFFLLSGVVIANAYEARLLAGLSAWRFTLMRAIRIYPLYVLGCAITVISILTHINGELNRHLLPLYILMGVLILPYSGSATGQTCPLNPPSWTLFVEMLANILYAIFIRFISTRTLIGIMCISIAGILSGLYFGHTHSLDIGWTLKGIVFGLFRAGYSFFAGVLIYRVFKSKASPEDFKGRAGGGSAYIPLFIMASAILLLIAAPSQDIQPYFDFVAVVGIFPAIVYAALWFEPTGITARTFKFLGAISYAVYALHYPLGHLIQDYLQNRRSISVEDYAPAGGIVLILALAVLCWLLDRVYDEPVRRYLIARFKLKPTFEREKV